MCASAHRNTPLQVELETCSMPNKRVGKGFDMQYQEHSDAFANSETAEVAQFDQQAIRRRRAVDANGQPRIFRRLRARWLRWQKPRRRK